MIDPSTRYRRCTGSGWGLCVLVLLLLLLLSRGVHRTRRDAQRDHLAGGWGVVVGVEGLALEGMLGTLLTRWPGCSALPGPEAMSAGLLASCATAAVAGMLV